MAKTKDVHVGGQQIPLFVPHSDWKTPTELPDLRRIKRVSLDTETRDNGLNAKRGPGWAYYGSTLGGHLCGISVAWRDEDEYRSFYAPVAHPDSDCLDPAQVRQWILDHQRAGVRFAMQNGPYDVGWMDAEWGIQCPDLVDDAICMAYMIDETRNEYNLDALCQWRGLPGKDESLLNEAAAAYGFPDVKQNLWRLPARFVGPYAEIDAIRTLQLADSFDPEIDRQELRDAYQLEMDLLPVVHQMRKRGIRVDLEAAARAKVKFKEQSAAALRELSDKLSHTVGIDEIRKNSWLERVFTELRVAFPRDEKTQRGSFDKSWMAKSDHWLPRLIVRAKGREEAAEKFVGNYIESFTVRGRLHASVNQFKSEDGGTRTYRFSYSNPPLQQMPHRDEELAHEIRGLFIPEDGEGWYRADYSQQEYRLIVHYAESRKLPKAREAAERYRGDPKTDFHSMVAEMTGLERKPAKDTNFAKSYGAGVDKFALMTNLPVERARAIMEQYDRELPFNKKLFEYCQKLAEGRGYIKLLDGARIHYELWEPAWLSREERSRGWGSGGRIPMAPCREEEAARRCADPQHPWHGKRLRRAECRKGMNGLIQGGAARQTKKAMRACWREGYVPLLQLHDELDFSLPRESDGERVSEIMRDVVKLRVPMLVDGGWGINWGVADQPWAAYRAGLPSPAPARPRAARAARGAGTARAARPARVQGAPGRAGR